MISIFSEIELLKRKLKITRDCHNITKKPSFYSQNAILISVKEVVDNIHAHKQNNTELGIVMTRFHIILMENYERIESKEEYTQKKW